LLLGKATPFVDDAVAADLADSHIILHPVAVNFGAPQPAMLDANLNPNGLTLHLAGPVLRSRLMQLATALPQFGDGLDPAIPPAGSTDAPIRIDLVANRTWSNGQVWTANVTKPTKARRRTSQR